MLLNQLKQLYKCEEQHSNDFREFMLKKGVPYFQASLAVSPFLASMEHKRNTFLEN